MCCSSVGYGQESSLSHSAIKKDKRESFHFHATLAGQQCYRLRTLAICLSAVGKGKGSCLMVWEEPDLSFYFHVIRLEYTIGKVWMVTMGHTKEEYSLYGLGSA
jgi:hypothetical protein